jgi:hypothetical protein
MHRHQRQPQPRMTQPGEQAATHFATFHQLAQHLDHHHLEQPVDHRRTPATLLEGFFEQQFQRCVAAIQIGQRQADEIGQRGADRVEPAALEMQVGAGHVGALLRVGAEAMRHRPRIQQQARHLDLHGLLAVADLQRATSHQVQLPGLILALQRVDAAQRTGMEHRGGDRETFKQNGETVDHDGTPVKRDNSMRQIVSESATRRHGCEDRPRYAGPASVCASPRSLFRGRCNEVAGDLFELLVAGLERMLAERIARAAAPCRPRRQCRGNAVDAAPTGENTSRAHALAGVLNGKSSTTETPACSNARR